MVAANTTVSGVSGEPDVAAQLRAAYEQRDLAVLRPLLADDVRWGSDDHPNRCRRPEDVLRTFTRGLNAGATADVIDVGTGPAGVAVRLRVHWPDVQDRARGEEFFHVFLLRDGLIAEIRRYDDRESAQAALATG